MRSEADPLRHPSGGVCLPPCLHSKNSIRKQSWQNLSIWRSQAPWEAVLSLLFIALIPEQRTSFSFLFKTMISRSHSKQVIITRSHLIYVLVACIYKPALLRHCKIRWKYSNKEWDQCFLFFLKAPRKGLQLLLMSLGGQKGAHYPKYVENKFKMTQWQRSVSKAVVSLIKEHT